ncbi:class I SAM-dependent methyltransferase [Streptomyces sp. NPDC088915]|uniref:class I SAM-dependent methyltransferase n=1 Tax=Streptomyces sp. NPDC088915 TaxID=3365912 RepID=UPI0037FED10D
MKGNAAMLTAPAKEAHTADTRDPLGTVRYLPSLSLDAYRKDVVADSSLLRSVVDFGRPGAELALSVLERTVTEFDTDETGRGDSYRTAQRDASVRWTGVEQLLGLCAPDGPAVVLDILGGDGTLARAVAELGGGATSGVTLLTSDISGEMVKEALAQGLPAVRQAADFLFVREGSVDAVLLAYGTHHIARQDRPAAVREALRAVRPGGRVVLHDFDEASPMARFFTQVVHHRSPGGHDYPHFTRAELVSLFADAATPARVLDVYDPLVVRADSEEGAREAMCAYVGGMYGVSGFFEELGGVQEAWSLLEEVFDHTDYLAGLGRTGDFPAAPRIREADGSFVAEVPRVSVVAVAQKAV